MIRLRATHSSRLQLQAAYESAAEVDERQRLLVSLGYSGSRIDASLNYMLSPAVRAQVSLQGVRGCWSGRVAARASKPDLSIGAQPGIASAGEQTGEGCACGDAAVLQEPRCRCPASSALLCKRVFGHLKYLQPMFFLCQDARALLLTTAAWAGGSSGSGNASEWGSAVQAWRWLHDNWEALWDKLGRESPFATVCGFLAGRWLSAACGPGIVAA